MTETWQPRYATYRAPRQGGGLRLAIFGFSMLVLAVSFFVGLSSWGKPSRRLGTAVTDVKTINSLAEGYRLAHEGRCTTPLELRSIVAHLPLVDPWGSAYAIRCDGPDTRTLSFGPDLKEGTSDDISSR